MSKRGHRLRPIDHEVVEEIRALHHKHPGLGHDGIARMLGEEGIFVDLHDLREFMKKHALAAGPHATWVSDENFLRVMGAWPIGRM